MSPWSDTTDCSVTLVIGVGITQMLKDIRDKISEYQGNFKAEFAPSFSISGVYDLFPERPHDPALNVETTWDNPYPFAKSGGVYIQFDEKMHVARIGQASGRSQNSTIDGRLWAYFRFVDSNNDDHRCLIVEPERWQVLPRFIVVV